MAWICCTDYGRARSGQKRLSTVARFPHGEDAWLVVASAGGSAHHPACYHNIAAHPDQVWIEFGGPQLRVTATQLDGAERAQALQRITKLQPRCAGYEQRSTALSPVILLPRRLSLETSAATFTRIALASPR